MFLRMVYMVWAVVAVILRVLAMVIVFGTSLTIQLTEDDILV